MQLQHLPTDPGTRIAIPRGDVTRIPAEMVPGSFHGELRMSQAIKVSVAEGGALRIPGRSTVRICQIHGHRVTLEIETEDGRVQRVERPLPVTTTEANHVGE